MVPSAPPSGPLFAAADIADSPSDLPVAKAARTSAASRPRPAALSFARTSSMAFLLPLPTCVFCRLDASPASTRVFTATAARSFFRSARRRLVVVDAGHREVTDRTTRGGEQVPSPWEDATTTWTSKTLWVVDERLAQFQPRRL